MSWLADVSSKQRVKFIVGFNVLGVLMLLYMLMVEKYGCLGGAPGGAINPTGDSQLLLESKRAYERPLGLEPAAATAAPKLPSRAEFPCRNETFTHIFRDRVFTPRVEFSAIPRIVHYAWCSNVTQGAKNFFTYRHFLALRSATSFINADAVYFYYDEYPAIDDMWYHTWLIELETIFPYFIRRKTEDRSILCSEDAGGIRVQWDFVAAELNETGGVYIGEHTILSTQLPGMAQGKPLVCQGANGYPALVTSMPGYDIRAAIAALSNPEVPKPPGVIYRTCAGITGYNNQKVGHCVDIGVDKAPLYPKHQWADDSNFNRLCRTMLYGKPEMPRPTLHDSDVIPRIAHYTYFGGGKMDFVWYLSVLSCLHVLKLDMVYIHGDLPPSGPYWNLLQSQEYYAARFKWIKRHRSHIIFGKRPLSVAHDSDTTAADIMYKYGGVHVDPDLFFIKEFDASFWRRDAVYSTEGVLRPEFPGGVNWGLSMAMPNSKFWGIVQNADRCFVPTEWHYNNGRILYKIYERNPELAILQPNLQIICTPRGECWTHDIPGVPDRVTSNQTGWMNDAYCLHYVHGHRAFTDVETAKKDISMQGSAARLVLRAAGLI